MKKIFLLILLILPFYIVNSLYYLDKDCFICPIQYNGDIIIRSDGRGDGLFASHRNGGRLHKGIDLLADVGAKVLAARSGRVIAATANQGMGKYVIIRHSPQIITIYGHLNKINVVRGDWVRQGDIIGGAGRTGNAKYNGIQSHLHFEIRKDGIAQDPLEYLQ